MYSCTYWLDHPGRRRPCCGLRCCAEPGRAPLALSLSSCPPFVGPARPRPRRLDGGGDAPAEAGLPCALATLGSRASSPWPRLMSWPASSTNSNTGSVMARAWRRCTAGRSSTSGIWGRIQLGGLPDHRDGVRDPGQVLRAANNGGQTRWSTQPLRRHPERLWAPRKAAGGVAGRPSWSKPSAAANPSRSRRPERSLGWRLPRSSGGG